MVEKKVEYSKFAQYYIEISNELDALNDEMEELHSVGEEVPQLLTNEILRHKFILTILTQAGQEIYNKSAKDLYKDGWNFWFKEDAELREGHYGRN